MCEKTKADMSGNKLKMPISLQPPPAQALTGQRRPLIPCVNEWCPQNNTQSPLSIHLALPISPIPLHPLSTPLPCPLCHPSFFTIFSLFCSLHCSLPTHLSDPSAIPNILRFQPSLVPVFPFRLSLCTLSSIIVAFQIVQPMIVCVYVLLQKLSQNPSSKFLPSFFPPFLFQLAYHSINRKSIKG